MSAGTRLEHGEGGRLVVVKHATGENDVERLHREARMLTLASHPGVVELLDFRDLTAAPGTAGDGTPEAELRLAHAGAHALDTMPLRSVAHASGLVAALAETVADLHSIGIVHRRIDASHVLVDADGRPILAGFAGAALIGDPGAGSPSEASATPVRPSDDLPGLGGLLQHLIGSSTEPDPIPDRRLARRAKGRAYLRRALLNLADQATVDDPSLRPSARSFATAIRAVEPNATLLPPASVPRGRSTIAVATVEADELDPSVVATDDGAAALGQSERPRPVLPRRPTPATRRVGAAPRHPEPNDQVPDPSSSTDRPAPARPAPRHPARPSSVRRRGPRRGLPAAAGLLGVAALAFGILSTWQGERPNLAEARQEHPSPGAPDDIPLAPPPTTGSPPMTVPPDAPITGAPTSASTAMAPSCSLPAPPPDPAAAVGACHRAAVLPDGVLVANGSRFALGQGGDEVLVGDWTCRGEPVPALARPSTGDVYLFPAWATPGADVVARFLGNHRAGSHLASAPDLTSQGCPRLIVRRADGTTDDLSTATDSTPHTEAKEQPNR